MMSSAAVVAVMVMQNRTYPYKSPAAWWADGTENIQQTHEDGIKWTSNIMGCTLYRQVKYKEEMEAYDKALDIWKDILSFRPLCVANIYELMGDVSTKHNQHRKVHVE